ncbi:hypothetical protein [Neobacillus mesonae]|uniref:hypothetical protein n=1 Tax=Neobacillus mesonae TaxID=1193713 RepID=UPI0008298776|nr:hypothetical protein [Neobacillus mesonae]
MYFFKKAFNTIFNKDGRPLVDRLKNKVLLKNVVYKKSLEGQLTQTDKDNGLLLISLNQKLLDEMFEKYKHEIPYRKYNILRKRLSEGSTDTPYVVIDSNNEFYGYYNISFGENFDPATNYIVPDELHNIYLFDDYTFVDKRGKGAHKFSVLSRLREGKKKGFKTATVIIRDGNINSEKSYGKYGFTKSKEIKYYKYINKTVVKELK